MTAASSWLRSLLLLVLAFMAVTGVARLHLTDAHAGMVSEATQAVAEAATAPSQQVAHDAAPASTRQADASADIDSDVGIDLNPDVDDECGDLHWHHLLEVPGTQPTEDQADHAVCPRLSTRTTPLLRPPTASRA